MPQPKSQPRATYQYSTIPAEGKIVSYSDEKLGGEEKKY